MASPKTSTRRGRTRGAEQSSGTFGKLQTSFRDTVSEIKKVTWPDQDTTRKLTAVVIGLSVFLGILLGGIDAIFIRVWENIPSL